MLTWVALVVVLALYIGAAVRGLRNRGFDSGEALVVMMIPVLVVFAKQAIDGGSPLGAARSVIAVSLLVLAVTVGRPERIFDRAAMGSDGRPASEEGRIPTLARQLIFLAVVVAGTALYGFAGWTWAG